MILVGITAVIVLGGYWLLSRLDSKPTPLRVRPGGGHNIGEASERRGSWKDWENP